MDNLDLGPVAAGIAGGVVYQLVGYALGWRHEVILRIGTRTAFAVYLSILTLAVLIATVYLSVTTTNRRLDNMEARLTHMEQIIQNMEKHNSEMMSNNSANSTLPENPGDINEEDDYPQRDETMYPDRSEDSQDDAPTMKQHKPWRLFNVPDDHVLVVLREGETLRVHIRPPSDNLDQNDGQARHSCDGQPREWWTPSMHNGESYRTLFWSRPGEELIVPFAWPFPDMWGRLTAALLKRTWDENPPVVEEKTPPQSFTIAVDEVLFYRPYEGRTARVLIAAREDVVHGLLDGEKLDGRPVTALPPKSVLPLSFKDSQRSRSQKVHPVKLFYFSVP